MTGLLRRTGLRPNKKSIAADIQASIETISEPFDAERKAAGLTMVPLQMGQNVIPTRLPVINEKPAQFDEIQKLRANGQMSEEEFKSLMEKISSFEKNFEQLSKSIAAIQGRYQDDLGVLQISSGKRLILPVERNGR